MGTDVTRESYPTLRTLPPAPAPPPRAHFNGMAVHASACALLAAQRLSSGRPGAQAPLAVVVRTCAGALAHRYHAAACIGHKCAAREPAPATYTISQTPTELGPACSPHDAEVAPSATPSAADESGASEAASGSAGAGDGDPSSPQVGLAAASKGQHHVSFDAKGI